MRSVIWGEAGLPSKVISAANTAHSFVLLSSGQRQIAIRLTRDNAMPDS